MSQGVVVEAKSKTEEPVGLEPEPQSEEAKVEEEHAKVEECDVGSVGENNLVDEGVLASVSEEILDDAQGRRDDIGIEDVCVKNIVANETREKLAEAIQNDSTLATARALAHQVTEGYHWIEGLLFRTRLDALGDNIEQLCLPEPCLQLTRTLGMRVETKCVSTLSVFFYWPSMTADVSKHCKSCEKCQKHDKQLPRQMLMQEREIVTIPSERVCIDLVGPFLLPRGGSVFC